MPGDLPKDFPPPEPGLDAVVRAQLDAESTRTDPQPIWDRLRQQLEADPAPMPAPVIHRGIRWRRVAAIAVMANLAAVVIVALFFLTPVQPAFASPAEAVRSARTAHSGAARCYTQTISFSAGAADRVPLANDNGRTATLWTRGGQFVVQPGFGGHGAWGRDASGRIWFAPTPEAAARFDDTELPPVLQEVVKIRGLDLTQLLDDLLANFDLAWAESPPTTTATVTASRRGAVAPFQIRSARFVVESKSLMIRSLTLRRQLVNDGEVTITFALADDPGAEPGYAAEDHIKPGAAVYDGKASARRKMILLRHLGGILDGGL